MTRDGSLPSVLAAVAFGAVLGPEMPVVALGSAVGVVAHRMVRLGGQEGAVLSTAGSFSAISALFGGPLVARLHEDLAMDAQQLGCVVDVAVAADRGDCFG